MAFGGRKTLLTVPSPTPDINSKGLFVYGCSTSFCGSQLPSKQSSGSLFWGPPKVTTTNLTPTGGPDLEWGEWGDYSVKTAQSWKSTTVTQPSGCCSCTQRNSLQWKLKICSLVAEGSWLDGEESLHLVPDCPISMQMRVPSPHGLIGSNSTI